MKRRSVIVRSLAVLLVVSGTCAVAQQSEQVVDPVAGSGQIIVVTTSGWSSPVGSLACFQRDTLGATWKAAGIEAQINLGRSGLAWGLGLHGTSLSDAPEKHEGDGKSPAGVFRLSAVFGYADAESVGWLHMPYVVANTTCQCIDDSNSVYYNLVLDSLGVSDADWRSRERMRLSNNEYEWGVIVDHNASPRVRGRGSCIFLHVWESPAASTSGCTSLEESTMLSLVRWLDTRKNPVLVQLPSEEYARLRAIWRLPYAR